MIRSPSKREVEITSVQNTEAFDVSAFTSTSMGNSNDGYKRAFDLTILLTAHLLLLPVFVVLWTIIPLAIWLGDRGPIFYTQRRVGRGGKVFVLLKFRSMVEDAESSTGPVWASGNDPRITRVGRILRATVLDELPQVINVWKGNLSLVGPRPERPELIEQFSRDFPQFLRRLETRPGLTGLAQVFGRYSSRPRNKLHYDMLYVRKMSLWLDVKLLFLSVMVTFRAKWQVADKQIRHHHKPGLPRWTEAKISNHVIAVNILPMLRLS